MHYIPTPKEQARLLKQTLAAKGIKLGHQDSLEAVAALMGFRNWQTMDGAGFARVALLSEPESALLDGHARRRTNDLRMMYDIRWPGQPAFDEELGFVHRGLKTHGYTQCSQWLEEEAEKAGVIPAGFDVSAIQSRIDSGELVFSLANEHQEDISAYRFRRSKGWVELVNFSYSAALHDANAPRYEGRFGYAAWRFNQQGVLLHHIEVNELHSLTQCLVHLLGSNDFGGRTRKPRK